MEDEAEGILSAGIWLPKNVIFNLPHHSRSSIIVIDQDTCSNVPGICAAIILSSTQRLESTYLK